MLIPQKTVVATIGMMTLVLANCTNRDFREDAAKLESGTYPTVYETQVSVGPCIASKEGESIAALGTALATSLVNQGLNRFGAALGEAAKEHTDTAEASRNVVVEGKIGPCIQIARGKFYLEPARLLIEDQATDDDTAKAEADKKLVAEEQRRLAESNSWFEGDDENLIDADNYDGYQANSLFFAGKPDFLFEGRIVQAVDPLNSTAKLAAFTVVPQIVYFDSPIATRLFRSDKDRAVTVFLAIHEAGKRPDLQKNAAAALKLGRLASGQMRRYPHADRTIVGNTGNRWAFEADWFALDIPNSAKAMTVSALVTEHQGADEYLKFAAAVFGDIKGKLGEQIIAKVDPATSQAANDTAATAAENEQRESERAQNAFETSLVKAVAAIHACTDPAVTDVTVLQVATNARAALRAYNQAARALGMQQVRDATINAIRLDNVSGAQQRCSDARDELSF